MKCTNCNNTLMLSIVPKRFATSLALFPVRPYRCIRCGKLQWHIATPYRGTVAKIIGIVCVFFFLGIAAGRLFTSDNPVSVQQDIVQPALAVAEKKPTALPDSPSASGASSASSAPGTPASPASPDKADTADAPVSTLKVSEPKQQATQLEEISLSPQSVQKKPAPLPKQQPVGPAAIPAGPRTAKILTRSGVGAVTVIVSAGSPIAEYHSFMLNAPKRLVVDIPGEWTFSGKAVAPVNRHIVKTIRTGVHKKKLRLVIDLTRAPEKAPEIATAARGLMVVIP